MPKTSALQGQERLRLSTLLLFGFGLLSALPVVALGFLQVSRWSTVQEAQADREVLLAGGTLADNLAQILEGYVRMNELAAAQIGALGLHHSSVPKMVAMLRQGAPGATVAYVAEASGQALTSDPPSDTNRAYNYSDRGYFRDVMESKKTVISSVIHGRMSREKQVAIATPIFSAPNEVAGLVTISIGLTKIAEQANRLMARHRDLHAIILDEQGTLVNDADTSEQAATPKHIGQPIYAAAAGLTGALRTGDDLAGVSVRAAVVPLVDAGAKWRVIITRPIASIREQAKSARNHTIITAALGLLACLGLTIAFASWLSRPLRRIAEVVVAVGRGDLSHADDAPGLLQPAETANLMTGLSRMSSDLRAHSHELTGVVTQVTRVLAQIEAAAEQVSQGTKLSQETVDDFSSSLAEMSAAMHVVHDQAFDLSRDARAAATTLATTALGNEEIAGDIAILAQQVSRNTGEIGSLNNANSKIARTIDELDRAASQALASVRSGDLSLNKVQTNAVATAHIAEQTAANAARGVDALERTGAGVDNIRKCWSAASTELDSLLHETAAVGGVLDVIESIATKTNLLALNASIIASQAGEHGKGFAVVADEIKRLASSTGLSTREIAAIVKGVQEHARATAKTMGEGLHSVTEGLRLTKDAATTLAKIQESATQAELRVKEIVAAALEQAETSRRVGEAIEGIAARATAVSALARSQSKSSDEIATSAENMVSVTSRIGDRVTLLAQSSHDVAKAIQQVATRVAQIETAQGEQTQSSERMMKSLTKVVDLGANLVRASRELQKSVESLSRQAHVLQREVQVFR
jgi:methyl-accepting chemotaxis protein